ncbi:hypothetical protein CPAR01_06843, partial [Colletotrichum paranaense]
WHRQLELQSFGTQLTSGPSPSSRRPEFSQEAANEIKVLRYGPQTTTSRPVSKLFALCPAYPQTPWVCYLVLPISSSHLHSSSGIDPASTKLRREVGFPSLSATLSITL